MKSITKDKSKKVSVKENGKIICKWREIEKRLKIICKWREIKKRWEPWSMELSEVKISIWERGEEENETEEKKKMRKERRRKWERKEEVVCKKLVRKFKKKKEQREVMWRIEKQGENNLKKCNKQERRILKGEEIVWVVEWEMEIL